jgi:hypothetical protein
MEEIFIRAVHDILGRSEGPMNLRLIVQPIMAVLLAIRSGLRDAKENRPGFLAGIVRDRGQRRYFLTHGCKDIGKVFCMAALIDVAYQLTVFKTIYPIETLVIAFTLSIFPYVIVRGPVNRLSRLVRKNKSPTDF